jgi:hypothetical protein
MSIEHADLPIAAVQFHRESPWRSEGRMITAMIEPDNWPTKARQGARRLVIRAGLSDEDIDRMTKQAQKEVEPLLG